MGFEETKLIINELASVYESNKELQLLENITATRKDIDRACTIQHQQLQQLVNQQIQTTIEAEKASHRSEPEAEHKKRMNIMQRELNELDQSIQEMESMRRELEKSLDSKANEIQHVTSEREMFENSWKEETRVATSVMKLFQHVANITWDLSSSGRKGYILSKTSDSVKYFENPAVPTCESVNRMWAMLEGEVNN